MIEPRHVVCVLGTWNSFEDVTRVIADVGGDGFRLDDEFSQLEPDDRMAAAFAASADRVDASLGKRDDRAIARHSAVAYILSPQLPAGAAQAHSARMLAIIGALLDGGALAVKGESAGIAHGAARWRDLAKEARSQDPLRRANALRLAFVRRPIGDDELYYSCGMHLLGERDIELAGSADVREDLAWMDTLALYLLGEKPARGVHAGEGFRLEEGGARRVLRAKTCKRYATDDFFFNPYGYWRIA